MDITVTEFLSAAICFNEKGKVLNMTNRPSSAIIMTKSGEICFCQNGKNIISSQGCPIFIPEGQSYINTCLEDAQSMMINFHADTDISEIISLPQGTFTKAEPGFNVLCALSVKAIASPLSFSERCRAMAEIYEILEILTCIQKNKSETELLFDRASEFILSSIASPELTCGLVAKELNISEVYLRRLFVKYSGVPTWKYITKIRLERAKMLLSENSTVKNAACMTGFSDVYSFSRAYSNYFGYPPSKT